MNRKTVILLAMHGMPPSDFPRSEMAEWRKLHSTLNQLSGGDRAGSKRKYIELDEKIRSWPRNEENDLYHGASYRLAEQLKDVTGCEAIVGFNEFCNPTMEDGFESAVQMGADRVLVITPMMTRGGSHSESDIPEAIARAKSRHPNLKIKYVWPFDERQIAEFLSRQLAPSLKA